MKKVKKSEAYIVQGQIDLFDFFEERHDLYAVSCADGRETDILPVTEPQRKIVPDGEYLIYVGKYPMILRRTKIKAGKIPEGHKFYHYMVGPEVYAGIFIGVE